MSADPEVRRKMINAVPMGREGRVEEVAHANLLLASDAPLTLPESKSPSTVVS